MSQSEEGLKELSSPIGLIAGNGILPLEFAKNAKARGYELVVVAHKEESDDRLKNFSKELLSIRVGELNRLIKFLKRHGVKHAAMAGGLSRVKIFGGVKPDFRSLKLLARLRTFKDDLVLRGIAGEIESEGISIIAPSLFLKECVPSKGTLTKRSLSEAELENAKIGWEAAKLIGACDIGQTVVVANKTVVAVETIEGTDETISRAGKLTGGGLVVVKVAKPQQDLRFDLPTIGEKTIQSLKSAKATALVVEEGKTMILEPEKVVALADEAKIAIEVFG